MPPGSITLSAVAGRTEVLSIACTRCNRAGRYQLAALIEKYGLEFYDLCGVHCPVLSTLFGQ